MSFPKQATHTLSGGKALDAEGTFKRRANGFETAMKQASQEFGLKIKQPV